MNVIGEILIASISGIISGIVLLWLQSKKLFSNREQKDQSENNSDGNYAKEDPKIITIKLQNQNSNNNETESKGLLILALMFMVVVFT